MTIKLASYDNEDQPAALVSSHSQNGLRLQRGIPGAAGRTRLAKPFHRRDFAEHARSRLLDLGRALPPNAPFQTADSGRTAIEQWFRLWRIAVGGEKGDLSAAGDHASRIPHGGSPPTDSDHSGSAASARNGATASSQSRGVDPHHERVVAFSVRQWLDCVSPSNVPWLNPEVIEATRASRGANLSGRTA